MKTKLVLLIITPLFLTGCYNKEIVTRKQAKEICKESGDVLSYYVKSDGYFLCDTVGNYCRKNCEKTFDSLPDTKHLNTNNQDAASMSIMRCVKDCKSEFKNY